MNALHASCTCKRGPTRILYNHTVRPYPPHAQEILLCTAALHRHMPLSLCVRPATLANHVCTLQHIFYGQFAGSSPAPVPHLHGCMHGDSAPMHAMVCMGAYLQQRFLVWS